MNQHDWFYRVYRKDTSADVFGAFAPVVQLWQSSFAEDQLPEWTAFDFDDLTGWYEHISLSEVGQNFSNMVYLLWGTEVTELWGADYTGTTFADNKFPEQWQTIEQPYIETVVKQPGIGVCGGTLHRVDRDFINITYIDLPVSRAGKSPYLLSAYLRNADRTGMESTKPFYAVIEEYKEAVKWQNT